MSSAGWTKLTLLCFSRTLEEGFPYLSYLQQEAVIECVYCCQFPWPGSSGLLSEFWIQSFHKSKLQAYHGYTMSQPQAHRIHWILTTI